MSVSKPSGPASPAAAAASQQQQHPVPFLYRLALLYIEPILALHAGLTLLRSPLFFLNAVSPNYPIPDSLTTTLSQPNNDNLTAQILMTVNPPPEFDLLHHGSNRGDDVLASVRILTDMLGIMHLVCAFNLAVVLRVAGRDGRLWRVMNAGMLLSDMLHIIATFREYRVGWWDVEDGSSGETTEESAWRAADWVNFGILGTMVILRLGLVLGIGVRSDAGHDRRGTVAVDEEPPHQNGKTEAKELKKRSPS